MRAGRKKAKSNFSKASHKGPRAPKEPRGPKLREVTGVHAGREALQIRPRAVEKIWLKEGWERSEQLSWFSQQAKRRQIELKTVSLKRLDELSSGHQGVAVFLSESPALEWEKLQGEGRKCVALLDGIVDPHNLGAMIRTAWLMGVEAIFVPRDRAVGLTATVCKVASGGAEHVPLVVENNFVQSIKSLKELGFWVYSLAEKNSENIYKMDLPERVAWVVGAEEKGVRGAVLKESDACVQIPQVESGSSYNASVALGIALSETARAHKFVLEDK